MLATDKQPLCDRLTIENIPILEVVETVIEMFQFASTMQQLEDRIGASTLSMKTDNIGI